MEENNVTYDMVSKEDVQRVRAQLQAIPIPNQQGYTSHGGLTDISRTQFYRIPFTQVGADSSHFRLSHARCSD